MYDIKHLMCVSMANYKLECELQNESKLGQILPTIQFSFQLLIQNLLGKWVHVCFSSNASEKSI